MNRRAYFLTLLASLPLCAITASQAAAAARSYSNPVYLGEYIHQCLADGTTCGKPAADAFCRLEGYENALSFRLQRDPARITTAVILDSGRVLRGAEAQPFDSVKCWRPNAMPSTVQFGETALHNVALPGICNIGQDCRKSVADRWCEQKGYVLGAKSYEIDLDKELFRSISCATL
jgi:hypothetical protein